MNSNDEILLHIRKLHRIIKIGFGFLQERDRLLDYLQGAAGDLISPGGLISPAQYIDIPKMDNNRNVYY